MVKKILLRLCMMTMFIGLVIVIYASDIEGIDFENEKCLAVVELTEDEQIVDCIVNKNLNDVAIIIREKKWGLISEVTTYFVYHNGNRSEPYDYAGYLTFSPDGKKLAYATIEGNEFWKRIM
ncbi:MAG TPA: hypothetical protein PKH20_04015, partial [Exilispira sp.]|nr:hypothetical protein [Exilispira sp.]